MAVRSVTQEMIDNVINRRNFLTGAGALGLGAAAATVIGCSNNNMTSTTTTMAAASTDTAAQIFTAALIAESLAITTYYTALSTSGVITDSNLAGAGGTATSVSASGSVINVAYLQAALIEEVAHAQLLRTLLGLPTDGSKDSAAGVPQSFYYPTGTFSSLQGFVPVLVALETAFIGAYMTAVEEFSSMAAGYNSFSATQANPASSGSNYTQAQLINFAKVSAAILGVEAEHRALVRGIPAVTLASPNYAGLNLLPANNVNYESDASLTGLIVGTNGSATAAAALTPFIAAGTNPVVVATAANMASFSSVVNSQISSNVSGSIPAAE